MIFKIGTGGSNPKYGGVMKLYINQCKLNDRSRSTLTNFGSPLHHNFS